VASRDRSERVLLLALVLTFGTAIAFIVAIVGELEDGVAVHEIAGTLLLAFLLVGLAIAVRIRSVDRRPLVRVAIAIGALVAAGITGAGLATGTIPMGLAGLPLVPLVVLLAVVGDGIRVTVGLLEHARTAARRA
jgi:4-amino-4-deoxy-L-arabinose transferase-like glycosyltransferase